MFNTPEDPLISARHRFPMVPGTVDYSEEIPGPARPFALRGAPVVTAPTEAKHRTPNHQTKIPQSTHLDDKVQDDSYTVPDD